MKKLTLFFASLLCVTCIAMAQLKLYVYQNDGTRNEFVASTVDSIAFSIITDVPNQPDDPVKPEETFSLIFDSNGGNGTMPAIDGENGDKVTIPASTFTRNSYNFVGWNTKANGTGTAYTEGQSITLIANLTLYAQWEEVSIVDNKLYFVNKEWWIEVRAYIWSAEEGEYIAWPGEYVYKENYNINGYEVYSYDMSDKQLYDMIIFNGLYASNSDFYSQTSDLEIDYSKPYYYNGNWYATTDEISDLHKNHEYVDLGLPSGLLWATCNVGAGSPEDYGDYFAWGEITTKSYYAKINYTYSGHYFSDDYDAANANWGGSWRMPTDNELWELINECYWTWTTQNGVKGYKVESKTNDNSIFLPAAGYRSNSDLNNAGSDGYYWSTEYDKYDSRFVEGLEFESSDVYVVGQNPAYGLSVRPVMSK